VRNSKQSKLHFKLTSSSSSNPNTSSITAKTGTESVGVHLQDQSIIIQEVAEPGMHSKTAENSLEVPDEETTDLTSPVTPNLTTCSTATITQAGVIHARWDIGLLDAQQ